MDAGDLRPHPRYWCSGTPGAHLCAVAQAIQPFFTSNNITINNGQENNVASITVPNGFTWVVESMSGRFQLPTGQHISQALVFTNSSASNPNPVVFHANPSLISPSTFPIPDVYLWNHLTRAYVTGTATISVARYELAGDAQINFTMHGYLIPAINGDYNANGAVDAADYVAYRKTLGQMGVGLFADGNGDNMVESGDLGVWRSQFGKPNSPVNGAGVNMAVPEPASMIFLLMTAVGVLPIRRR